MAEVLIGVGILGLIALYFVIEVGSEQQPRSRAPSETDRPNLGLRELSEDGLQAEMDARRKQLLDNGFLIPCEDKLMSTTKQVTLTFNCTGPSDDHSVMRFNCVTFKGEGFNQDAKLLVDTLINYQEDDQIEDDVQVREIW